jgi:hypothetical protein
MLKPLTVDQIRKRIEELELQECECHLIDAPPCPVCKLYKFLVARLKVLTTIGGR